jgi:LacI family transcriptional regulator
VKSVSLVDVAHRAGVSVGTVSHVLNGRVAARIAPETQARVRQAAEEMGYRPNVFARSLLGKQTKTWSLILGGLVNPFFVGVAKAIQRAAGDAGYRIVLNPTLYETGEHPDCVTGTTWPVDGVLVWGRTEQDLVHYLGAQAWTLPVVYLGYEGRDPVESVGFDLYGGALLALEHLVGVGCRRIAYVLPGDQGNCRADEPRRQAYETVCRESGLHPELLLVGSDLSSCLAGLHAGVELAGRPVYNRPDAVFCFNDALAIGVYHGIRRAGLHVPKDIGIVGFDGIEEGQCLDQPLTKVSTPAQPLAEAAVALLLRRLAGDRETYPERIIIPTALICGKTTR